MRIDIVVGGRWHAPQLAAGLRDLGHDVVEFAPHPWSDQGQRVGSDFAMRLGRRLGRNGVEALVFAYLAEYKRKRAGDGRPDMVIAWSSFARALRATDEQPLVLIRGSHHIRRQREILGDLGPSWSAVRREEAEYAKASLVSVPTREIAVDKYWGSAHVVSAPYGFPSIEGVVRAAKPPYRLAFLGEISVRKGADRLSGLDEVPEIKEIVMIGRPKGPDFRLPQKARLMGQLRHEHALRVLKECDALILLSREEGMARAGMEALALGLPVLASEASGLGGWLANGGGYIVEESTGGGWAPAVQVALQKLAGDYTGASTQALVTANSWTWADHAATLLEHVPRSDL